MKNFFSLRNLAMAATIFVVVHSTAFAQSGHPTPKNNKQMILTVRFKTSAENAEAFKNVLIRLFDTISHEENFVDATLHEEMGKPGEFLVYETWNDNIEHFIGVQMKKPYAVQFEQTLKDMNVERTPNAYTSFGHWVKK